MPKTIVLTGGGTAGHVIPHEALLPSLKEQGWEVSYIGGSGIEKTLVPETLRVPFFEISTGKLRRYRSWDNLWDVFRVIKGFFDALGLLIKLKPRVILSKGGYVSVPVVLAGACLRIPVLTHESDLSLGLANRIILPFARRIFYSFPQTGEKLPRGKSLYTGQPVRLGLLEGSQKTGLELCGFAEDDPRPILLIMGGSQGAQAINQVVLSQIHRLTQNYRLIHLTGVGKSTQLSRPGSYKSFEYVKDELPHLMACARLVLGRAGAGTIFECLALGLPMLLVPLVLGSRGDQLHNGRAFEEKGWARVLEEPSLETALIPALESLMKEGPKSSQGALKPQETLNLILGEIQAYAS
jgi:UDP-N-acetylglucosamine--N-acetylmuramyl-(pentapeptide) pyrophosphoryl-undecaprenol N-acetylglucosamine transferase